MNINSTLYIDPSNTSLVITIPIIVCLLLIGVAIAVTVFIIKRSHRKQNLQPSQPAPNEQPVPASAQQAATQPIPKRKNRFLIFLIKLFILGGIAFFALWNYRLFEFNKGWSKNVVNDNSFKQTISRIVNIEKIEYYKVPHSCNDDNYRVHISTSTESYLFEADKKDIEALNTLGFLSSNLKPKSVTVIPFYVEIIVGLFVIFIPFGRKK